MSTSEEQPLRRNNSDEIKTPKPKLSDINYRSFCNRVQYVISTVNDNEFNAATTAIDAPDVEDNYGAITTIDIGVCIGMIGRHAVGVIQHGPGSDCADVLKKAIQKFFPNAEYLVAVGVCYGFSREVTSLADVVIAEQIVDLGNYRMSENSIEIRGDHTGMMGDIKNIFCRNPKLVEGLQVSDHRKAKHFVGKIASGPNLVDNAKLKEKINYQVQPKAYGGEMEGGGLLKLQKNGIEMQDGTVKHMQVIVIKAVVDYADGTKNKDWQFIGAQAAFHYVTSKIELQPEKYPRVNSNSRIEDASDSAVAADGQGSLKSDSGSESLDSDKHDVLTDDHFATLSEQLKKCKKDWERIAIALGFKPNEIDDISTNPMILIKNNGMDEVIKYYLRWAPGDDRGSKELPTIQALQAALNKANYARIKVKI